MPEKLTLYHAAPSRSMTAHWMLEELGVPFDLHVLDLQKGEQKAPDYLAINPMGKVPALRHGDAIITETPAICLYLADAFPEAGLTISVGDPLRGPYLSWFFFVQACLEPVVMERTFERTPIEPMAAGWGDVDVPLDVLAGALEKNPYLLGDSFTAADLVVGAALHWGMVLAQAIPKRPVFEDYCTRLEQRPALQRHMAKDTALMGDSPSYESIP